MSSVIKPIDLDAYRQKFQTAEPFPFVTFDEFLEPDFAAEVAAAYPTFADALERGFSFNFVNEKQKIQIMDPSKFPEPVTRLNEAIQSQQFRDRLSYITGIPDLISDDELVGAGMHITGPQGRLDVHVDFNYIEARQLHRRLNILIYLNPEWEPNWGGEVELWDVDVRRCYQALQPRLNRCVIFETSDHSFHGVAAVNCPEGHQRRSFAAYYYTREPPSGWDGQAHSTVFRARPDERFRGYVLMPAERLQRVLQDQIGTVTHRWGRLKQMVGLGRSGA